MGEGGVTVVSMDAPMGPRAANIPDEAKTAEIVDLTDDPMFNKKPDDTPRVPVATRCTKEPNPGECRAWVPRWYWSEKEGGCKVFGWGGCYGSLDMNAENNFKVL